MTATADALGDWIDARAAVAVADATAPLRDTILAQGAANAYLQDRIAELVALLYPAWGPPPGQTWYGAYNGNTVAGDEAARAMFGPLKLATTYYQANKTGPGPMEAAKIEAGVVPHINIASKNLGGDPTKFMYWVDIAAGKHDPFWTGWGKALGALDTEMLLAFDQEPDVRLVQKLVPTQMTTDYVLAYRRIHDLIAPLAPKVKWSWWVGGNLANADLIESLYPGDAYVDWIGYDPYKWASHPPAETPIQVFRPFHDWLATRTWGQGKPRYLAETGIDRSFGDDACALWWSQVPDAARQLDLAAVVFFHSQQWTVTGMPKTVAAVKAAFRTTNRSQA